MACRWASPRARGYATLRRARECDPVSPLADLRFGSCHARRSDHNVPAGNPPLTENNMTQTGYQVLGFDANPFNANTAELEPEIAAYAVHPPYLDRTSQASGAGRGVFFLEGARGSGKSATRLTVAKELFKGPGGPLLVSLTSFNVFRPYLKGGLSVDLYATQVAFLVAETLLGWLASLPPDERERAAEPPPSLAAPLTRAPTAA